MAWTHRVAYDACYSFSRMSNQSIESIVQMCVSTMIEEIKALITTKMKAQMTVMDARIHRVSQRR